MFLNGYPYTDFHEMNLDFLLKSMNELKQAFKDFTASNSLIFADPIYHDISTTYAKNTIVIDADGNAYIAKQNVPSGVQLGNTDYWMLVFDFEGYVERANKNFTVNYFSNVTRSDRALEVGDWLVLDDVLYKVIADIPVDGEFIIGTNIVHFTVEEFLKDFTISITNLVNQYKDDIDASELAYVAAMQAEVDRILAGATVDSEVIDARLGANNINYSTLGNAIRNQLDGVACAIEGTGNKVIQYQIDKSLQRSAPTTYKNEVGYMSVYIACQPGDIFYLKGSGGLSTRLWFFSDANLNNINSSPANTQYTEMTKIVAPLNAAYLSVNSDYTVSTGVLVKADSVTKLASLTGDFTNAVPTYHLFDSSDALTGYELNTDGTVSTNATWFVSDYINVEGIDKIFLEGKSSGSVNFFYDANNNMIKKVTGIVTGGIDVPPDAIYFRCNGELKDIDDFDVLSYYTYNKSYQYLTYTKPHFKVGYLVYPGGAFSPNSTTTVTQDVYIKATKGSIIGVDSGYQFRMALYSSPSSDDYIVSVPDSTGYRTSDYTFTEDVYFRISIQTTDVDDVLGVENSAHIKYKILQDDISSMRYLQTLSNDFTKVKYALNHYDHIVRPSIPFEVYTSPFEDTDRTLFNSSDKRSDISTVYDILDAYVDNAHVTKEEVFTLSGGLKGYAYKITPKTVAVGVASGANAQYTNTYPTIMIMCNQHGGGERNSVYGTTYFIKALLEKAEENPVLDYISKYVNLIVVPSSNPWGYNNGVARNENNVDLDRNWDYNWEYLAPDSGHYSGVSAASELETQGMQALVRKYHQCVLFIDFHTNASASQSYQLNWIANCGAPLSRTFENDLASSHLQRITPVLSDKYNIDTTNAAFIGYITNHAQSGAPKGYAQLAGIQHSSLFEGINAFPGGSNYSNRSQAYVEEIIGNYLIEFIRCYYRFNLT